MNFRTVSALHFVLLSQPFYLLTLFSYLFPDLVKTWRFKWRAVENISCATWCGISASPPPSHAFSVRASKQAHTHSGFYNCERYGSIYLCYNVVFQSLLYIHAIYQTLRLTTSLCAKENRLFIHEKNVIGYFSHWLFSFLSISFLPIFVLSRFICLEVYINVS
jgi:hypothetical protein